MVFVGKASAWPSHYWYFKLDESIEYILAVSVHIRDIRVRAYPQTSVDACSEMLGKLSVDFFGDDLSVSDVGVDCYVYFQLCQCCERQDAGSNCCEKIAFLNYQVM